MHVLKFTQETGEPSDILLDETIGFNDSVSIPSTGVTYTETLGFRAIVPEGISVIVYETIGFDDGTPLISYYINLWETVGFNDGADESLKVYVFETIGFNDSVAQDLDNQVLCNESIGFGISGYHEMYVEHDITFSWRTRTNADPTYGYGASEYGAVVSFGDGDASNLSSFEVHIWKIDGPETNRWLNSNPTGEFDDRLTKQVITIADTDDPDADASYTLTIANNKSFSGGVFTSDLEVEIFVKDSNGVYSFPKIIKTNTLKVDHEE